MNAVGGILVFSQDILISGTGSPVDMETLTTGSGEPKAF